jgi:hypothetical protein
MADIRPVDQIARKWAGVTPQRASDYESGVKDPRKDWARNTAAAAEAWAAGVQAAIQNKLFAKGVGRAGTPKWQNASVAKGVSRWGPGVQLAEEAYSLGFAPYREAIARVQLPPRYARRDPRNLARVNAIVEALKRAKESAGG